MDRQQPQNKNAYNGRFGSSADAQRRRPTGSYRSSPSGSYRSRVGYGESRQSVQRSGGDSYTQRPSAQVRSATPVQRPAPRTGGDAYTRRPEPRPEPKKQAGETRKRVLRGVLIAVILVLLALAIVALITTLGQTVHQMPTIEYIGGGA